LGREADGFGRIFRLDSGLGGIALDQFKQGLHIHRFADDHGAGDKVLDSVDVGFGGEEKDSEGGVFFGEFAAEVVTAAAREADIHKGQIDIVFRKMRGGGFRGGVGEDLVAVRFEDVDHCLARAGVVFEIEDAGC